LAVDKLEVQWQTVWAT